MASHRTTMLIDADNPPAVPLWIDGHACLTLAPAFMNVCDPVSGEVLRRTPLCNGEMAVRAVESARAAQAGWRALGAAKRLELFAALAGDLVRYVDHFSDLIVEESGKVRDEAVADLAETLSMLCVTTDSGALSAENVVVIIGDAKSPLLGPLRFAVPALSSGAVVVVRPDPRCPSAMVAFAELAGRCGFPPGVFNVVHGSETIVVKLRESMGIDLFSA